MKRTFSFPTGGFGKNVIIFGVDTSSSVHVDNKKNIYSTAEKKYSTNSTVTRIKYCLSLHYNGANSYLFVNGTEIIKLKLELMQFHYV